MYHPKIIEYIECTEPELAAFVNNSAGVKTIHDELTVAIKSYRVCVEIAEGTGMTDEAKEFRKAEMKAMQWLLKFTKAQATT